MERSGDAIACGATPQRLLPGNLAVRWRCVFIRPSDLSRHVMHENFLKGSTSTVAPVQTDALHATKSQGLMCHGYTNISPLPHTTSLQYFVRKHKQFTCKTILMSAAIFSEGMLRMRTIFCLLHPLETTKSTIKIEFVCVYSYVIIKDVKH